MNERVVIYSVEDGVARIVMNRPESLNAINFELSSQLYKAFSDAREDNSVRVAILTGAGKAFSAGGDMSTLKEWTESSPTEIYRMMKDVGELMKFIISFPKPLITAVNGPAVGGGCSLALSGDIIIASESASFGQVFSRLNLVADMGSSFLLPNLVGILRAKELIFSGRIISAKEAQSYGMVSEVVPDEKFHQVVEERAKKMARWATRAIGMAKVIINKWAEGADLDTILELEAKSQALLFQTEDTREGIMAFLEKRKPDFKNR
jgi:2-(1,2-epoxy-1,2-dihydrophenyl)acetyl-CoA isomerase